MVKFSSEVFKVFLDLPHTGKRPWLTALLGFNSSAVEIAVCLRTRSSTAFILTL